MAFGVDDVEHAADMCWYSLMHTSAWVGDEGARSLEEGGTTASIT
jgi:hypothetical protein